MANAAIAALQRALEKINENEAEDAAALASMQTEIQRLQQAATARNRRRAEITAALALIQP